MNAGASSDGTIRITGGHPTDDDIAAVTAVLTVALDELAGDHRRRQRLTPTAWERSQRGVRTPLTPGTWNIFGA